MSAKKQLKIKVIADAIRKASRHPLEHISNNDLYTVFKVVKKIKRKKKK